MARQTRQSTACRLVHMSNFCSLRELFVADVGNIAWGCGFGRLRTKQTITCPESGNRLLDRMSLNNEPLFHDHDV